MKSVIEALSTERGSSTTPTEFAVHMMDLAGAALKFAVCFVTTAPYPRPSDWPRSVFIVV